MALSKAAFALLVPLLLLFALVAPRSGAESPPGPPPRFTDVTADAGITFKHWIGKSRFDNILETVAPGLGWLDYDNDGYLDLYCVQSGRFPGSARGPEPGNVLYHNNGDGTFTDVTATAKVGGTGYGMGVTFGDYDNDGWTDIYVTNYGGNALYHNNHNGTFADVTPQAGVSSSGWSTGATFFDYDNDGYLDLYVAHYVDYKLGEKAKRSMLSEREGYRYFPGPRDYHGQSGTLYHNNRDGTFTDVTRETELYRPDSKGLGVVAVDYDGDGWVDLLVANDRAPINLFHNNRDGTFKDVALEAGVAFDENGNARGSMGVDAGDYNGDGRPGLVVTNMVFEGIALYRSAGQGAFEEVSRAAKIAEPSYRYVGWGVALVDYNNDGYLDLLAFNGHVQPYIDIFSDSVTYAQEPVLLENLGNGAFADRSREVGPAFSARRVARGAAFGDYDNDGDVDIAVATSNGPVVLLRNEGGNGNNWIEIKLIGSKSNRDAVGARVRVTAGGRAQVADVKGGSSYLSQNDPRLHFGLGQEKTVGQIQVRFPSGTVRTLRGLPVNRVFVIREDEDRSPKPGP